MCFWLVYAQSEALPAKHRNACTYIHKRTRKRCRQASAIRRGQARQQPLPTVIAEPLADLRTPAQEACQKMPLFIFTLPPSLHQYSSLVTIGNAQLLPLTYAKGEEAC